MPFIHLECQSVLLKERPRGVGTRLRQLRRKPATCSPGTVNLFLPGKFEYLIKQRTFFTVIRGDTVGAGDLAHINADLEVLHRVLSVIHALHHRNPVEYKEGAGCIYIYYIYTGMCVQ